MSTSKTKKNPWMCYEREVPHTRFCDPACGGRPAEKLQPEHLRLLQDAFTSPQARSRTPSNTSNLRRSRSDISRGLELDEFRETLVSGSSSSDEQSWIERLFNEVDIYCTGRITWHQLCSYLLQDYKERQRAAIHPCALLDAEPSFTHCSQNQREPTVRIISMSQNPPLRYLTVSRGGQVTVWNSHLDVLDAFTLTEDEAARPLKFRGAVTDATWMGALHRVAIATDCREVRFVNVSPSGLVEEVILFGFHSIPTAVCFGPNTPSPKRRPVLVLGDENGGVHLMRFLNSSKGLFKSPSKRDKSPQRIYFQELGEHGDMVSYRHIPGVHRKPVGRVMFDPDTDVIVTSSESELTSVVITSASLEQELYVWRFKWGAKCFDYSPSLHLLATGSSDLKVRLWTRYVTLSPMAVLLGHQTSVLDVAIYHPAGELFSYSSDSELRVWDIPTHLCLKVIQLHFPCLHPSGDPQEHGCSPLLLGVPHDSEETPPRLVVCCKDYLAHFPLAGGKRGVSDHWVSCCLYNPALRQVVTGHTDSSLCVWDVLTGGMRLRVANAHGEAGLTCVELDFSRRKLITTAANGTIKVWNLLNGLNLHKLEPVAIPQVVSITCLRDDQLLSAGCGQCIVRYRLAEAKDCQIEADLSWRSGGVHTSDISLIRQCSALGVVATASLDGEIVVWRVDSQKPLLQLPRDATESVPVDGLLFLHSRAADVKLRAKAVLVSSQAGRVSFWSIAGQKPACSHFYAPDQVGQRVLGLSSDHSKNSILVSGDTAGRLQIWDITSHALNNHPNSACERPPLLKKWTVSQTPLVSVGAVEAAGRLFILAACAGSSAGLWTVDGECVGFFGQEGTWDITDPATYLRRKMSDTEEEEEEEERMTHCVS